MTPESKTKVPRPITTVERQIFAAYAAAEARADRAERELADAKNATSEAFRLGEAAIIELRERAVRAEAEHDAVVAEATQAARYSSEKEDSLRAEVVRLRAGLEAIEQWRTTEDPNGYTFASVREFATGVLLGERIGESDDGD